MFVDSAPVLADFLAGRDRLLDECAAAKGFLEWCRFNASTANIEMVMTLADQHDRVALEELKCLAARVLAESFQTKEWQEGTNKMLERSPRANVVTFS